MTEAQIKTAITSPWPFFGVTPHGDILARYVPMGPVFRWQKNHLLPMFVQGSDLVWLLHAAGEDGHSLAETDPDSKK